MRRLATAVLLALTGLGPALADEPVKIIVPFAAGGPVDAMARILAQEMQGPLGATIVVENRAGGGGVIAADFVSRAAPDGKTLLMGSQGSHVITAVLQPHVKYDPVKSFEAIAMVGASPTLLVANPQLPFKDFKDLVELAKTRHLSYASAGPGTTMHIAGELINTGAGIKIAHVPYRGAAPALPDLVAGRIDVIPADPPVLLPMVQAGQIRPVVVLGVNRLASLPDTPTTTELGYSGMVMENWYGLLAPAGVPPDMVKKLEAAALTAIKSAAVQEHMKKGEISGTLNSAEFAARIARDAAYWRPMLPKLGIVAVDGPAPAAAATPAQR